VLLGNPYPSGLDADLFAADNANLDNNFYFWDHNTGTDTAGNNNSADWAKYNTVLSSGTAAGSGGEVPDGNIGTAQGFFATLNSGSSVTFENSHRVGDNDQFYSPTTNNKHLAWLNLTNDNDDFNQILIGALPEAKDGKDGSDGSKFNANPNLSFYSVLGNEQLGIQGVSIPSLNQTKVIELGVIANVTGNYTIALDSTNNWPNNFSLKLVDTKEDVSVNLKSNSTYSFNVDQADTLAQRFYLNITNQVEQNDEDLIGNSSNSGVNEDGTTTLAEELTAIEEQFRIYQAQDQLWIDAVNSSAVINQVEIITIAGQTVRTEMVNQKRHGVNTNELSSGIYFVNLNTTKGQITQKVFIR